MATRRFCPDNHRPHACFLEHRHRGPKKIHQDRPVALSPEQTEEAARRMGL